MLTTLLVASEQQGCRLDAFLQRTELAECGALSLRCARALCDAGAVAVGGVAAPAATRLKAGQRVSLAAANVALTIELGIAVAHADAAIVVLHKRPGLAVHKGPLVDDCVADRLARALPAAGLAQRLDREASGLLLVGRTTDALRHLGAAMEGGEIDRDYLAIVAGTMDEGERTIDLPLLVTDQPQGGRPKTIVDARGQRAISHVRVVDRRKNATLVRVRLGTGRTHQIRAHLAAIGYPLLGDGRYGDPLANRIAYETFGIDRTLLHCARLAVPTPERGKLEVEAVHEVDFVRLFPRLPHEPKA